MEVPINKILNGDALTHLKELPNESINCCMTSPPYWALRDYGSSVLSVFDETVECKHNFELEIKKNPMDRGGKGQHDSGGMVGKMGEKTKSFVQNGFCTKCNAWKGQLGLEPTFDLYIKHLCDIFDEVKRVLRNDGTCWVNLGDTYVSTPAGNKEIKFDGDGVYGRLMERHTRGGTSDVTYKPKDYGTLKEKNLVLIPFRFAIEMQNRGWILRNVIIWHKPNCMPSSVKDRFTVDFEYIFFFVKNKKYWFETQYENSLYKTEIPEEISDRNQYLINKLYKIKRDIRDEKIAYSGKSVNLNNYNNALANAKAYRTGLEILQNDEHLTKEEIDFLKDYTQNHFSRPEGRNKRTVWTITTKPFKEAHFATYPEELCETPIKAGCPEFVCNKCGKAREKQYNHKVPKMGVDLPVSNTTKIEVANHLSKNSVLRIKGGDNYAKWKEENPDEFLGYSDCKCGAGFSGGIVLDPFFGAGTTGLVALKQKKQFIGIELNPEYIKIAKERLKPYLEQEVLPI